MHEYKSKLRENNIDMHKDVYTEDTDKKYRRQAYMTLR